MFWFTAGIKTIATTVSTEFTDLPRKETRTSEEIQRGSLGGDDWDQRTTEWGSLLWCCYLRTGHRSRWNDSIAQISYIKQTPLFSDQKDSSVVSGEGLAYQSHWWSSAGGRFKFIVIYFLWLVRKSCEWYSIQFWSLLGRSCCKWEIFLQSLHLVFISDKTKWLQDQKIIKFSSLQYYYDGMVVV